MEKQTGLSSYSRLVKLLSPPSAVVVCFLVKTNQINKQGRGEEGLWLWIKGKFTGAVGNVAKSGAGFASELTVLSVHLPPGFFFLIVTHLSKEGRGFAHLMSFSFPSLPGLTCSSTPPMPFGRPGSL